MSLKIPPVVAFASAMLVTSVQASETLAVLPDSGEDIGMVGGRLANLTDPSAARHSPTNILRLDRPEAQLTFGAWYGDVKFTSESGETIKMDDPWKYLGSLYFATPVKKGRTAFGLAVTAPFGLSSFWPKNTSLRYLIPYEATLVTVDINPVIAIQATDQLSFALGLDVMYSQVDFKQFYPWAVAAGLPLPDGVFRFKADGWGIGGFGAVRWDIAKNHRLTAIGRLPIRVRYDGDFRASNLPAGFEALGYSSRSDFESDATFPGSVAVGYGWDVSERLSVGVDFQYTWNSSHDDFPARIGNNQALIGPGGFNFQWQDSYDIGVGFQYKLTDSLTLRAGYMYSEWSQQERYYTPSVPSSNRHLMSVGGGWESGSHRIDLAYTYAYFEDRDIRNAVQPAFNGHYDMGWQIITLSYGYKF